MVNILRCHPGNQCLISEKSRVPSRDSWGRLPGGAGVCGESREKQDTCLETKYGGEQLEIRKTMEELSVLSP